VYHLVTHIDGRAVQRQCALDYLNGSIHTGTEAARISE
jgi:hypothetical protein